MRKSIAVGLALLLVAVVPPTTYIELATRRYVVSPEAAPAVPWGIVASYFRPNARAPTFPAWSVQLPETNALALSGPR